MRKDIKVSVITNDIVLKKRNSFSLCQFNWVGRPSGFESRYIYGEVVIPSYVSENEIRSNGLYVSIPYTPIYNEIRVRFKQMIGDTSYSYIQNPVDGSDWFVLQAGVYGHAMQNIFAPQLITISEDVFYLKFNSGVVEVYNGEELDFNIVPANIQNRNMLLKCVPTNSYHYPLTGVGLIRWSNSNIDQTGLADVIQREFQADGVGVFNAYYDFDKKSLILDLDTSRVDKEE